LDPFVLNEVLHMHGVVDDGIEQEEARQEKEEYLG
jgi:hypothetical protein